MKSWHFIGLQIALGKKKSQLCGKGTQKLYGGEGTITLLKWMDFLNKSPKPAVDKCVPHSNSMFANSEGWGAEISGKQREASAVWELGSTERDVQRIRFELTWKIISLAERDTIFPYFINRAKEISRATSDMRHFEQGVAHEERSKSGFYHLCRCWDSRLLQANESSHEIEQPSGIVLIYTSFSRAPYFLCCVQPTLSLNFCSTAHPGNSLFAQGKLPEWN